MQQATWELIGRQICHRFHCLFVVAAEDDYSAAVKYAIHNSYERCVYSINSKYEYDNYNSKNRSTGTV
jgi:hypothetical protein